MSRRQRPATRQRSERRTRRDVPAVEPRDAAYALIRSAALGEALHRGEGPPPADTAMFDRLTASLLHWETEETLRVEGLSLIEWLATDLGAYLHEQCGRDRARVDEWLVDHGDRASQAQQRHPHPAGPTAVEILSVAVDTADARRGSPADAARLVRLATAYHAYVREGHEVEDVRELSLVIGMWAGQSLAALMRGDTGRIRAYVDARTVG